jgi:hypothetical protein
MTEQYRSTQQAIQAWRNVPVVDEVVPLPPPPDVPSKPAIVEANLGFVITIANLLITAIIITAMMLDGTQAKNAIVAGSIYFAVTMTSFALVITGTLSAIVAALARERTERQRIKAYRVLGELAIQWRQAVEANRTAELQAQAMPIQLQKRIAALETELLEQRVAADPLRRVSTFVSPYDNRSKAAFAEEVEPPVDTTANEAIGWASGLYNELGQADPAKVQADGRLKMRMIGSSRGPGSREAGLWLVHKGVIVKVPGGFALNMRHFRTRESLRNLF